MPTPPLPVKVCVLLIARFLVVGLIASAALTVTVARDVARRL